MLLEQYEPYVLLPYKITLLSNFHCRLVIQRSVLLPYKITLLSNIQHIFKYVNIVLLPYKITLLSNTYPTLLGNIDVLLPYKITLLSNGQQFINIVAAVLLPYKITLLSNVIMLNDDDEKFYYLIKLHYSQTTVRKRYKTMQFYYLIKLHYSQTERTENYVFKKFYYLIKLHYSQTSNFEIMTLLISAIIRQNPYLYYITSFQYSQSDNAHVCINYSFLLTVKPIAVMAVYAYQRKPAQQHAFIQLICLLISQTAAQSDNKENALL